MSSARRSGKVRFRFEAPPRDPQPSGLPYLPGWIASLGLHCLIVMLLATSLRGCVGGGRLGGRGSESGAFEIDGTPTGLSVTAGGGDGGNGGGGKAAGTPEAAPAGGSEQTATQDNQPAGGGTEEGTGDGGGLSDIPELGVKPPVSLAGPTRGGPSSGKVFGAGAGFGAGTGFSGDARSPIRANGIGGPAGAAGHGIGMGKSQFFGIEESGTRFVYVLDCSGSMTNYGAIRVAKAELISSLQSLDKNSQFQIIFYNQTPHELMLGDDRRPQLHFATDINRNLARQRIDSVQADLGTDHVPALKKALRYTPEVIYFLTDADEPQLTPRELNELEQINKGRTRIHCIEFGKGPELKIDNFLRKLARQNGGRYRYEDVTQFGKK